MVAGKVMDVIALFPLKSSEALRVCLDAFGAASSFLSSTSSSLVSVMRLAVFIPSNLASITPSIDMLDDVS